MITDFFFIQVVLYLHLTWSDTEKLHGFLYDNETDLFENIYHFILISFYSKSVTFLFLFSCCFVQFLYYLFFLSNIFIFVLGSRQKPFFSRQCTKRGEGVRGCPLRIFFLNCVAVLLTTKPRGEAKGLIGLSSDRRFSFPSLEKLENNPLTNFPSICICILIRYQGFIYTRETLNKYTAYTLNTIITLCSSAKFTFIQTIHGWLC